MPIARRAVGCLLIAAAFAVALPHPAAAAPGTCGDIQLVFKNPDLQPGSDGIIRAQGQFFAQFQAIGADADKIAVFGFSFGPRTTPVDPSTACAGPVWVSGAYIYNYRADRDPTDGFFIPLKTSLVPDGDYSAAVHAYDSSNKELARFWVDAVVDNCDAATNPPRCDGDLAQIARQDKTAPWPMVLPGDGQALPDHILTIEFAEEVKNLRVTLNGTDITNQLVSWEGREWDADLIPDYGPEGLGAIVAPPCSQQPPQECIHYGPAWEWKGRALTNDDVIRVEADDVSGNHAVKAIHIGSSVAGGAVTDDVPILSYTVDKESANITAGGQAEFHFKISNNGAGVGHPFATAEGPTGWTLTWDPVHVVVGPGETKDQKLIVAAPGDAVQGTFDVKADLKYDSAGTEKSLEQPLKLVVGDGKAAANTTTSTQGAKKSPGAAMPIIVAGLAAVAVLARRGRRAD
jgi:hypothetical protein